MMVINSANVLNTMYIYILFI